MDRNSCISCYVLLFHAIFDQFDWFFLTGSQHCDSKIQQIICISIHGSLIQNFVESVLNIPHTSPLPLNNLECASLVFVA